MVSVITFFVYLSTYYFTTIQNMQTDNERYKKMASLAQIGWWEVDLTAGCYLCSDYLSDLLGLDGDTISTSDFLNLIREDYRKQIAQEFSGQILLSIRTFTNKLSRFIQNMVRFGCIPVWLFVRRVRVLMEVISPSE